MLKKVSKTIKIVNEIDSKINEICNVMKNYGLTDENIKHIKKDGVLKNILDK
ncbi:MAG: hypothetical protein Ta2E_03490 [Mycoplasmoidaceae bacterium]|nr:MAG: hypothetical protein Ta2E_03490 [Mycoplasmoidaceae bacterium]